MKKMRKIVSFLLTLAMIASMASMVLATDIPKPELPTGNETLNSVTSRILGFIRFIGYGIAVGMLLYIGIKYMMSSAADKADLKKGSVNYVIGAILVAGATAVVDMLITFGSSIGGEQ